MFVTELFNLFRQLPVHKVGFALSNLNFFLLYVTKNLGSGRTIRREQLFDGSRGKIYAGFGHNRVDNLASAVEVSATGGVVTHTSAADALFVLLIALFTGFFVLLGVLNVAQSQTIDRHEVQTV